MSKQLMDKHGGVVRFTKVTPCLILITIYFMNSHVFTAIGTDPDQTHSGMLPYSNLVYGILGLMKQQLTNCACNCDTDLNDTRKMFVSEKHKFLLKEFQFINSLKICVAWQTYSLNI